VQQIILRGGDIHYTNEDRAVYKVMQGTVLVYLIPVRDGVDGRRLLIGEMEAGSRIPGFYHASELYGEWRFGLAALDTASLVLEDGKADDELIAEFSAATGIRIDLSSNLNEAVIEQYEKTAVKEEGYLYAAKLEKKRTREQSLGLIHDYFDTGRSVARDAGFEETGRTLYDAAAYLCAAQKIKIAPVDRITESCGRRYDINDLARISHFVIREVVLEKGWWRGDYGALLCYSEDDRRPVACVPKGPKSYEFYDPGSGRSGKLDSATAETFAPKAVMFYRPFPEKVLTRWDIFSFGMQKVYRSDILRMLGLTLLGTLIGLLVPFLNEQAYDKFIPMGNAPGLAQLGAVLLACSLGNILFTVVRNLASFRSMSSMKYAVQAATFDRLFSLPESFFRDYDAAELGQRALGVSQIYSVLAQNLLTSLLTAVFALLYLWRMFNYSSAMSVRALVMLVAVMAILTTLGFRQIKYEEQKRRVDLKAQSISFQNILGISKIRNAWSEDRAVLRYLGRFVESRRINRKKEGYTMIVNTVSVSINTLFSVIFYYMMIRKDVNLSIGEFTAFAAAFGSFAGAMLSLVQSFLMINEIKPIYDYARPILETLPEVSEDAGMPGDIEGEIEVSRVTFGYDPDEPPVLRDLNLHIKPGEYVGIVGTSGCGKSTLLKLLLGFEKPQLGKIYFDKRDIDELDKRELRKKFGVVLQNGGLITGSIYENITITSPGATVERVEETLREVGLEEDIKAMPMGLHTVIAEGAGTISGGQAQRLLIARAIVGRPKVIFLDEATSALDNVTQRQVVDTLESIDATKLVIAHRLSTVRNCDRIIVMDQGNIAEQGSYEELMAKKGLFYDLAIRQLS